MIAPRCGVFLVFWSVVGIAALLAAQPESTRGGPLGLDSRLSPPDANDDRQSTAKTRLREGMHLSEAPGHFESAADVPVFVDVDGRRLTGLENLNLQRIVRTLLAAEDPTNLQWKVTGTITEYEGRNYILIERAVYTPSRR